MRLYSGGLNAMVRWFVGVASLAVILGACSSGGGPGSTCVCAVSVNADSATIACGASACVGGTTYSCGASAALTKGAGCEGGGGADAGTADSSSTVDAGGSPDSGGDASAVPHIAYVFVKNYEESCVITVNGGAPSSSMVLDNGVTPGSTVTIVATPNPNSLLGMAAIGADPWFGIPQNDGGAAPGTDDGGGATESTRASVIAPASKGAGICVSLCCLATHCPTANPCTSE